MCNGGQDGALGVAIGHPKRVEAETGQADKEEGQADDGKEEPDPALEGRISAWSSCWSMARTSAETTGRGPRRIQLAAVERLTPRSRKSMGSRSSHTRSRMRRSYARRQGEAGICQG